MSACHQEFAGKVGQVVPGTGRSGGSEDAGDDGEKESVRDGTSVDEEVTMAG